jgi:hypothetical protein
MLALPPLEGSNAVCVWASFVCALVTRWPQNIVCTLGYVDPQSQQRKYASDLERFSLVLFFNNHLIQDPAGHHRLWIVRCASSGSLDDAAVWPNVEGAIV